MNLCLSCAQRFETLDWSCPKCGNAPGKRDGYFSFSESGDWEDEGFEAGYFETLAKVEAGSFWFQARNLLIIGMLKRYFPEARALFEVGCGTGFVLEGILRSMPGVVLTGSDIFPTALPLAERRVPGVILSLIDARRLPFDQEFDVIGAFDVLEHIREDEDVLSELFRATKPGGGLILTVPQHPSLWSVVDDYSYHKRRYKRTELIRKVRCAGFQLLRATSFVSLLLPVMLLSRVRLRASVETFDPMAEYRISRGLNAFLGRIMSVERRMIQLGYSLPVGGSLLLVAERPRN